MRTLCSGLALIALAACATDGPKPMGPKKPVEAVKPQDAKAYKVTYYRFQSSPRKLPGSVLEKTEELHPEYYVLLSRGWKQQYGSFAREPFEKSVPSPFKGLDISDDILQALVADLEKRGWNDLPATDLATIDTIKLLNMERAAKQNEAAAVRMRYITVQTPSWKKTVCVEEALLGGVELSKKFRDCEKVVMATAMQYTIKVSVGSEGITPK